MDEKISKLFLPLVEKLFALDVSEPFRYPVDVEKYKCYNYYDHIKHPIDLSTIKTRLLDHKYNDVWLVIADFQLMFNNAWTFNKRGTPVYEFTKKLHKTWAQELALVIPKLGYCCSALHKFGPQLLFCYGTTPEKYCQIAVGAKYKCYADQYSFCISCFIKVESESIHIQGLTCETSRMNVPLRPILKSEFQDCTNDNWQYELFVQCKECTRRVHQICELYPAEDQETEKCVQHPQIEEYQKRLCRVPRKYRRLESRSPSPLALEAPPPSSQTPILNPSIPQHISTTQTCGQPLSSIEFSSNSSSSLFGTSSIYSLSNLESSILNVNRQSASSSKSTPLDDELLDLARDINEASFQPPSPSEFRFHSSHSAKDNSTTKKQHSSNNSQHQQMPKASVDSIAARLSTKFLERLKAQESSLNIERTHANVQSIINNESRTTNSEKFLCNQCYTNQTIGLNLRHRKWSARRLPHTRMSKFIETKVNEHIRESSPTAGEITVRVLAAYRDIVSVKSQMIDYVNNLKERVVLDGEKPHPYLKEYPEKFGYTNRAIFAWQDIDGVDVCVFGMHVQEYGEDCPEPNKQVVYLSYLDSVHFFRPKQFRTAVYHEILLSYFKYVKKLGFRRVFIWVCPSRKGDDYIFYRHPTEQKMPTLKRLSDWYINLLDKGIITGIVERHQNIYQYACSQNWTSILSMPYLSGDYWPGEFERLLNVMIESRNEYETRLMRFRQKSDMSDTSMTEEFSLDTEDTETDEFDSFPLPRKPPHMIDSKVNGMHCLTFNQNSSQNGSSDQACNTSLKNKVALFKEGDDKTLVDVATSISSKSDFDQPLDLTKSSSNASPGSSFLDEDILSDVDSKLSKRKKRKSSAVAGYTKRRNRAPSQYLFNNNSMASNRTSRSFSQSNPPQKTAPKAVKKSCTQQKDPPNQEPEDPETELIKNLERSLKSQKEGFIVAHLIDCDCSPHTESTRRDEESLFACELMKGREPFLQLARLKNYEFSTLRRAKFSSLAIVKHLSGTFKLDPICSSCYSFDSSKRYYACETCTDYYLCTSCYDNTHHQHIMTKFTQKASPEVDEFMQPCSLGSVASIESSSSSTVSLLSTSQKGTNIDVSPEMNQESIDSDITHSRLGRFCNNPANPSLILPLGSKRRGNIDTGLFDSTKSKSYDDENNTSRLSRSRQMTTNPSNNTNANSQQNLSSNKSLLASTGHQHQTSTNHQQQATVDETDDPASHETNIPYKLDDVLMNNIIRQASISHDFDFDEMKNESKRMLTHYWDCPTKDSCQRCKFVVLSCSFMSALLGNNNGRKLFFSNSSLAGVASPGSHPNPHPSTQARFVSLATSTPLVSNYKKESRTIHNKDGGSGGSNDTSGD